MRVIELYSPHVHSVCYSIHVGAGSLTDHPSKPGVALLTQRCVVETDSAVRRRGIAHGRYTSGHVTPGEAYIFVSGHRSRGQEIAELVPRFLREAQFTEEALELEKSVLWESLPESYEVPYDVSDLIHRVLLEEGLNFSVTGTRDTLPSITVEDVARRFDMYWVQPDVVLSVAGAYRERDLALAAEGLRQVIEASGNPPPPRLHGGLTRERRTVIVPTVDERFSLHLLFPDTEGGPRTQFMLRVLDCVLGNGPDSRVVKRLSWELGLGDMAGSDLWYLNDVLVLEVYVQGSYARFKKTVGALARSVESLFLEPPEDAEVEEALTILSHLQDYLLDDPQTAAPLRGTNFFLSRLSSANEFDKMFGGPRHVGPGDVHEVAQRILSWDNLSILYMGPDPEATAEFLEHTWPYKEAEIWDNV